jgi:hypothetical protein
MNIQTRLSAVIVVLLILSQAPMFAAQAFGDRTQTTSPAKSPSSFQTAKPSPQLRPAKNSVMFTAVPPAPAQDVRARHREDYPSVAWCLPNPWDYSPVAPATASPRQAANPSQEVVSSTPRIEEHTDERVQAMSRIGEN